MGNNIRYEIDIWRSIWRGLVRPSTLPSDEHSLKANLTYALVGNAIFAASQWGILTVLIKFGSSEIVGQFVFASAVATPVFSFFNLQLRQIQASDAGGKYAFSDYLGTRLLTTAVAMVLIAGLVIAKGASGRGTYVLLFGLIKAVESISDIHYGLYQRRMRMDRSCLSLTARGLTSLLSVSLVFYFSRSLFWSLIAILGSWAVSLIICDVPNGRGVCELTDPRRAKAFPISSSATGSWASLIKLGFPLGSVMIMIALETSIPRIIMDLKKGESELGIFAALIYPAVLGSIVITAVSEASLPQLAKDYFKKDKAHFLRVVRKSLVVALSLGLSGLFVTWLFGEKLLRILYTPEYSKHSGTFLWIMAGSGLNYIACFLGAAITAMQKFKIQTVIHGFNLGLLTVSSFTFIGLYGLRGGAYALLVSAAFLTVSYGLAVWKGYRRIKGADDLSCVVDCSH